MKSQIQLSHRKAVTLILVAAFVCYFISEAVLRQFVLHRAGVQSISLNSLLAKLPPGIRDEVSRKITIAELQDKLLAAKTVSDKIRISVTLAGVISEKKLQETYAEILDKYPDELETLSAYVYYLLAQPPALKSVSIDRYHRFVGKLKDPEQFVAWSSGLAKLKSLKASKAEQIAFLRPLLEIKPSCREYEPLYVELAELAFEEKDRNAELKARKLEDICGTLTYFDPVLEKKAKQQAAAAAKQQAAKQQSAKEGK